MRERLSDSAFLYCGDNRASLKLLDDCSIDSICTDPPYALTSIVKRFGAYNAAPAKGNAAYMRTSAGFMGQKWDTGEVAFDPAFWAECLRVLKPGGHMVAFSGTRTYHRMVCAIEDAGFEVRDQIGWVFGSGFPKSHDISKGIDRAAGAEREIIGGKFRADTGRNENYGFGENFAITTPATDSAREWQGWGTALKPAYEPICLAQKPYTPQQHLASLVPTIGSLLCKVVSSAKTDMRLSELLQTDGFLSIATSLNSCLAALSGSENRFTTETATALTTDLRTLRFSLLKITPDTITPAPTQQNGVASDVSLAAAISKSVLAKCERLASTTAGEIVIDWHVPGESGPADVRLSPLWEPICLARKPLIGTVATNVLAHGVGGLNIDGCRVGTEERINAPAASKGDVRIFESAGRVDASPTTAIGRWPANLVHDGSEEVTEHFPESVSTGGDGYKESMFCGGKPTGGHGLGDSGSAARFFYTAKADADDRLGSKHPTVKPVDLMQWLVRLVTPKGGLVLDPFAGTGTTGEACIREGMRCILMEREEAYQADIRRRIDLALAGPDERQREAIKARGLADYDAGPLFASEAAE